MSEETVERKVNRVWLTCPWEVNLLMGENARVERMNQLADYLSDKGYDVSLWFTTFEHPTKKYIANETKVVDYKPNLHIVLLHCPVPYKRNTSPIRFYHLSYLAKEMKKCIKDEEKFPVPDVILTSLPAEQNCTVLEDYAEKHNIPVIVDPRDMWPDIFDRAFPKLLRPIGKLALLPMKRRNAKAFRRADALCGINDPFQDWALEYAKREKNELDECVFLGCSKKNYSREELKPEIAKWNDLGVTEETWNLCLFSSLSRSAQDLETVMDAVSKVHDQYPSIRLIIGGRGDSEEYYRDYCKNMPFVHCMGWLNEREMISLMQISKMGLLCYKNLPDYMNAWGNKVGQYLAYGLPILSSSQGYAKRYFAEWNCGVTYEEGNSDNLKSILVDLINSDTLKKMSCNAIDRFESDFEVDMVCRKFEQLIIKVYQAKMRRGDGE